MRSIGKMYQGKKTEGAWCKILKIETQVWYLFVLKIDRILSCLNSGAEWSVLLNVAILQNRFCESESLRRTRNVTDSISSISISIFELGLHSE